MRAYDLTVTGSLTVSGSTTLTGDITYDDLTATGNIITTGANKVISGSVTSTGSFGRIVEASGLVIDNGAIFAPGNISGSVSSTGSFGSVHTAGGAGIGTSSLEARLNVYHDANNEWTALFTQDYVQGYGVKITGDMTGTDPLFKIMSENTATRFRVQGDGKVGIGTNSPDYSLDVAGDAGFNEYIYHNGDADTYIRFADNLVNLVAGGKSAIKYDASAGKIIINNTNENVDFHVMAEDNSELLATDAANNRLGINTTSPGVALEVVGSISGSATSTGSFGRLQVPGNANVDGNIIAGGTITAQEFHTEFVSASIHYVSGSTKFGDTSDDIHSFTGSVHLVNSGSVSGSIFSTGSFGAIYAGGMTVPN